MWRMLCLSFFSFSRAKSKQTFFYKQNKKTKNQENMRTKRLRQLPSLRITRSGKDIKVKLKEKHKNSIELKVMTWWQKMNKKKKKKKNIKKMEQVPVESQQPSLLRYNTTNERERENYNDKSSTSSAHSLTLMTNFNSQEKKFFRSIKRTSRFISLNKIWLGVKGPQEVTSPNYRKKPRNLYASKQSNRM